MAVGFLVVLFLLPVDLAFELCPLPHGLMLMCIVGGYGAWLVPAWATVTTTEG